MALATWEKANKYRLAARLWKAAAKRWWRLYWRQYDIPWLIWRAISTGSLEDLDDAAGAIADSIEPGPLRPMHLRLLATFLRVLASNLECRAVREAVGEAAKLVDGEA